MERNESEHVETSGFPGLGLEGFGASGLRALGFWASGLGFRV